MKKEELIKSLSEEQIVCLKKMVAICRRRSPKRLSTNLKRTGGIIALGLRIRDLQIKKIKIMNLPEFPKGGIILEGYEHGGGETILNKTHEKRKTNKRNSRD